MLTKATFPPWKSVWTVSSCNTQLSSAGHSRALKPPAKNRWRQNLMWEFDETSWQKGALDGTVMNQTAQHWWGINNGPGGQTEKELWGSTESWHYWQSKIWCGVRERMNVSVNPNVCVCQSLFYCNCQRWTPCWSSEKQTCESRKSVVSPASRASK